MWCLYGVGRRHSNRQLLIPCRLVEGKEIRTLEGEAKGGKLSHVQQAYAKSGAVQCGFCTPGLIMATTAMLAKPREKPLTITEIRRGLAGNLCRCTGYQMIVNTVLDCEKTK